MEPAAVVLRFLESVGGRADAEFYLALFRAAPKERFAAISVDANVARHASEAVALDLRFLAALGLAPVVLFGLLEPTEAAEQAARAVRRLEREGVPALPLRADDPAALERAATGARAGALPIVVFAPAADSTLESRFFRLGELLGALSTRKMIFLHRPGGLRHAGALVPLVNLTTEFEPLATSRELSRKQRVLLHQTRKLVFERVRHKLLVSITSPLDLLRELFTVKGAGTLLRRGAVIEKRSGFDHIDRERVRQLLASSFGRTPTEGVFARPGAQVYLEEGYQGVAIVVETPLGSYLTKFAVEREAQGEGMGRDLWSTLSAEHTKIFWRARADNPICAWYTKECDGLTRFSDWHVFWKGLAPEQIPAAIDYALRQPIDV